MTASLNIVAGLLQLVVPSYALRLVRRFGSQRVGWFIVIAFASLALLHLMGPVKPTGSSAPTIDIIYAIGSVLLLIGMGHVETLCTEREQTHQHEEKLREQLALRATQENSELMKTNQQLILELSRLEQMGQTLEETVGRYRLLFMESPHPMLIMDLRSCRFLEMNQAALRQYGFTEKEFKALTGRDLLLPRSAADFLHDVSKPCAGVESRGVWQHCRKDGSLIEVEVTAMDLQYGQQSARLILADDITQRQHHEEELRVNNRMQAMGRLAGGIAHHFGQIHTLIQNQATELLNRSRDAGSVNQLVQISAAVTRAAGLTRQLLSAGAQQSVRLEPVDLNELIRTFQPMLRRLVGKQVAFECSYGADLPRVQADKHLVEHIVVNLVMNAREAMPGGGAVVISTAVMNADGSPGKAQNGAGKFVRLTVSDTGSGMTPEVRAQLFEPFFTTKDRGSRLGLGLASVYGVVRQHSGWTECTSQLGVGTEFRVFLPCAPNPVEGEAESKTRSGKGTILLVEGDDRTRALMRCSLNWNGYRVIEADSSSLALMLWESQASNVDLLLTNVSFAEGLNGRELCDQLLTTKPALKVIYLAEDSAASEAAKVRSARCLCKPYAPEKLLEEVRGTLARA
jgi:two-component system, cell cycle sensor histidine kinase and response regulator CckA